MKDKSVHMYIKCANKTGEGPHGSTSELGLQGVQWEGLLLRVGNKSKNIRMKVGNHSCDGMPM